MKQDILVEFICRKSGWLFLEDFCGGRALSIFLARDLHAFWCISREDTLDFVGNLSLSLFYKHTHIHTHTHTHTHSLSLSPSFTNTHTHSLFFALFPHSLSLLHTHSLFLLFMFSFLTFHSLSLSFLGPPESTHFIDFGGECLHFEKVPQCQLVLKGPGDERQRRSSEEVKCRRPAQLFWSWRWPIKMGEVSHEKKLNSYLVLPI